MIRFYRENFSCHIVIDNSFEESDIESLWSLFEEEYQQWVIEFVNLYTLHFSLIETLYDAIRRKRKNILLHPHKERLARYLHKLGFPTPFSGQHRAIVDAQKIEIILIGGSADSFEKIVDIVKQCSFEHLTLIVVQHQQEEGTQHFDRLLQSYTPHKVSYAKDLQHIQKGRIYLAPHNKHLMVEDGHFLLSDAPKYNFTRPSISLSYESFSHYYKSSLLIIQECGYLNDGVDKLQTVKKNGSKIIIQSKEECVDKSTSMVLQALKENLYDYIFPLQEIINYIELLDKDCTPHQYLEYLLLQIKEKYGYDFQEYHHDMLQRRLEAFMVKNHTTNFKNIIGDILFNQAEFKNFFLEVSINVTEFFRNPKTYKNLQEILLISYKNRKNLKIWSAGCSNGEEPISLAILLDTLSKLDKSIIYATDFNQTILEEAKNGLYPSIAYKKAKENIALTSLNITLENYFFINEDFVSIQPFLKEKILYFAHNLVTDSSFNEFDIIICSNVLIYFEEHLQKRVFKLLYNSLKFGGYLILGEKEILPHEYNSQFKKYNNNTHIYQKIL